MSARPLSASTIEALETLDDEIWSAPEDAADEAPPAEAVPDAAPLYDVEAIQFSRYLASDPPPRLMLIDDLLPLDIVGLLASMGGTGKSVLLYQLAISVATGAPWLGLALGHVGGVLVLAAEDDDAELHRRGRRILDHYETLGPVDHGALGERLHIVSRIGEDCMLTRLTADGEVARTRLLTRVIALAQQIPDLRLIILDPTSRFRGGRANPEEDATRYIEALEAIRESTHATVLASVHVRKASIGGTDDGDQTAVRGSTALVDGARWVATMQRLRRDAAEEYGVGPDEAGRYARLEIAKTNYTRPWPGLWLRREAGGLLVPTALQRRPDGGAGAKAQARSDARYADVLERVRALLAREGPMSRRAIGRYAGVEGVLAAGDHAVRTIVTRAIAEGALVETDGLIGLVGGAR